MIVEPFGGRGGLLCFHRLAGTFGYFLLLFFRRFRKHLLHRYAMYSVSLWYLSRVAPGALLFLLRGLRIFVAVILHHPPLGENKYKKNLNNKSRGRGRCEREMVAFCGVGYVFMGLRRYGNQTSPCLFGPDLDGLHSTCGHAACFLAMIVVIVVVV